MDYTEELLWMLDKDRTIYEDFQKKVQENVAFVHSLGLKCDCVGWSSLGPMGSRSASATRSR